MAWIESHQSLRDNPKTRRLARSLDLPVPVVIGYLHMLWYWALDHAPYGDLTAFDHDDIADGMEWTGDADELIKALVAAGGSRKAGFLEEHDGQLLIHDWKEHGGRLAESRRLGADSGRYGNHKRWHVDRGKSDPDCTLCVSDRGESGGESGATSGGVATDRTDRTGEERTGQDKTEPDVSDDARRLTRTFAVAVKANGHKIPPAETTAHRAWLVEMDRLLRIDHADPADVERVIAWSTTDEFWRPNVQSVPKFREKFSQLVLQADRATRVAPLRPNDAFAAMDPTDESNWRRQA